MSIDKPKFELNRAFPFSNMIRPPTIICGTKRGVFAGASPCEGYNDLYNIYLDTGEMIPKVNLATNIFGFDFISVCTGTAVLRINKSAEGDDVPLEKLEHVQGMMNKIAKEKEYYKTVADNVSEELLNSSGGSRGMLKSEETAESIGRIVEKSQGSSYNRGLRNRDYLSGLPRHEFDNEIL